MSSSVTANHVLTKRMIGFPTASPGRPLAPSGLPWIPDQWVPPMGSLQGPLGSKCNKSILTDQDDGHSVHMKHTHRAHELELSSRQCLSYTTWINLWQIFGAKATNFATNSTPWKTHPPMTDPYSEVEKPSLVRNIKQIMNQDSKKKNNNI